MPEALHFSSWIKKEIKKLEEQKRKRVQGQVKKLKPGSRRKREKYEEEGKQRECGNIPKRNTERFLQLERAIETHVSLSKTATIVDSSACRLAHACNIMGKRKARKTLCAMIFALITIGTLTSLKVGLVRAQAPQIVCINSDGSVSPSSAPITNQGHNDTHTFYIFTGDISYPTYSGIVVERSNILIDGNGYIVQGSENGIGLNLTGTSNVMIENVTVEGCQFGIYIEDSSYNTVSWNNATANDYGIKLSSSSNNTVSGNNITTNAGDGIWIEAGSNNSVIGNHITNNWNGIYVGGSDNSMNGNDIANNVNGIGLYGSHNYIVDNDITANDDYGIYLSGSSNIVGGNRITNNSCGINIFDSSSENSIRDNDITANRSVGIDLESSSNNSIFHNKLVDNTQQAASSASSNVWDDGYPSGGNYWSDYNGTDANHDGLGDTSSVIDANNTDNYPLMGMFNSYRITYYTQPITPHACNVTVISNSTISDFAAPIWIEHPEAIFLKFDVSGAEGSNGFCRVSFPTEMMNGTYHVSVNGTEIPYALLPCSDANTSYLYFNYTHSTQEVMITPEFPSFIILPIFFMATLLAAITYRRKRLCN